MLVNFNTYCFLPRINKAIIIIIALGYVPLKFSGIPSKLIKSRSYSLVLKMSVVQKNSFLHCSKDFLSYICMS